jgi:hypothetical protein
LYFVSYLEFKQVWLSRIKAALFPNVISLNSGQAENGNRGCSWQQVPVLPNVALELWGKSVIPNSILRMQFTHHGLSDKTRKNSLGWKGRNQPIPLRLNFYNSSLSTDKLS